MLGAMPFAVVVMVWAHYLALKYTGTAIFERRKDPVAEETTMRGSESFGTGKLTLEHELAGLGAMTQAVEQLGLTRGLARDAGGQLTRESQKNKQQLINQLMSAARVKWVVTSEVVDLVSVSFTHFDPWLAEQMPNTLVSNYINRVGEQTVERLNASREFLAQQVDNCSNRVGELIKQRIDFEIDHAGVLPDSPSSLQESMTRMTSDIDTLRLQHEMAVAELARFEGLKSSASATSGEPNTITNEPTQIVKGKNPELTRLEDELQKTNDTLSETLSRTTEKHPSVEMLRGRIARLEERIKQIEPEVVLQKIYGTMGENNELSIQLLASKAKVETTSRELERLSNRLETYRTLLADFGPIRREYLEIIKKFDDKQAELKRYEDGLTEVTMALAAESAKRRTHINPIQAALQQFRPSEPSFWKVVGFAVLGGLGFGTVLVFLINWYEQSLITPEMAAKAFGLPVFGHADIILTPGQLALQRFKNWVLLPLLSLVLIIILTLCTFSLMLRLNYPEHYTRWRTSPVEFLTEQAEQFKDSVRMHFQQGR